MSTPNANDQKTTPPPSSGVSIGLIIGIILFAVIVIGVIVYVIKKRSNGGGNLGAAPTGAPTAANGLGVANQGPNLVPRTNVNVNAGKVTA